MSELLEESEESLEEEHGVSCTSNLASNASKAMRITPNPEPQATWVSASSWLVLYTEPLLCAVCAISSWPYVTFLVHGRRT